VTTGIVMSALSVAMLGIVIGVAASEALKHRNRLTVTSEAINLVRWSDGRETRLRRGDGDRFLIIPKELAAKLPRDRILTQLGTGRVIGLDGFSRGVVRRACERRGWSFDYDPGLGERHLRLRRDWGSRDWYWLRLASSPGENAARLTEADKFQVKAESSKAQRRTVVTR
jgi:hypothetical protein